MGPHPLCEGPEFALELQLYKEEGSDRIPTSVLMAREPLSLCVGILDPSLVVSLD